MAIGSMMTYCSNALDLSELENGKYKLYITYHSTVGNY